MSSLQIPSVKLEDLETFQANHFFGATTSLADATHPGLDKFEEELQYEEDDLGYYKDGTKRTLTDEQIEIFRHSEIHALLRERERLREEEAEAQSDGEDSENASKCGDYFREDASTASLKRKSVEDSEDSSTKRSKDDKGAAARSDGDAASTQQPQQNASSYDLNSRRKIVSYAED